MKWYDDVSDGLEHGPKLASFGLEESDIATSWLVAELNITELYNIDYEFNS